MEVTSDPEAAKRIAAERAAYPNPHFYKIDTLANEQLRLECSRVLHRAASRLGYSCMPKKSYINRGTYYAEVSAHRPTGLQFEADPGLHHKSFIVPNVAMGVGASPLEAAMDGYRRVTKHPLMLVALLECEAFLLGAAARRAGKLEAALDMAGEAIHLINVRLAQAEFAAHEDDDL